MGELEALDFVLAMGQFVGVERERVCFVLWLPTEVKFVARKYKEQRDGLDGG